MKKQSWATEGNCDLEKKPQSEKMYYGPIDADC